MNVSELLLNGYAWWILPCSLLVVGATFGLVPGLLLRLIVMFYPKDHPRREELFGELYDPEMGRVERFEWVFQQLETASRQGIPLRRRARSELREMRRALAESNWLMDPNGYPQLKRDEEAFLRKHRGQFQDPGLY